ncbi:TPA: hypothetical protein N0F65_009937 [Lagenidium giganteum]|uniref:Uncharacterized protein n=1 Tax=Lagenidium giganteum TaxID=4803 RepID=A0AAV2YKG9_9STRA|nr:TPA: hypothetical protein N0F65_009937 [Lagenidium giganteum]
MPHQQSGDKRPRDDLSVDQTSADAAAKREKLTADAASGSPSAAASTAAAQSLIGIPFSAALMAVTSQSIDVDDLGPAVGAAIGDKVRNVAADGSDVSEAKDNALTAQQKLQVQQLQQQQLQLLQLQQQQLQNMSPGDIAAMAAMAAQQMALGMMMMPAMLPFMNANQQAAALAGLQTAPDHTAVVEEQEAAHERESTAVSEGTTPTGTSLATADAFSLGSSDALLGAAFGVPGNDDGTPKRKRGRPANTTTTVKKDAVALTSAQLKEAEKALKQFPMWGYGMPMPFLPNFAGVTGAGTTPGADGTTIAGTSEDGALKEDDTESPFDKSGRPRTGKAPAKKKSRGTGKPRGRPRTRPRPGEIIRRAKPPPIAPANYSVMYNYSLSNLQQKSLDMTDNASGNTTNAGDDARLAASALLPVDQE